MDDSFAKGLRVIEILAAAEQPLGLTEIAERTGYLKSHAHKFLQTLIAMHYVQQPKPRGPYQLGLKLWELGARALARTDLLGAARGPMRQITAKTGETSTIGIYESGDVVYVYKIDGTREVRTNPDVGRRRPAYCVAAGKSILAFLPAEVIDALPPRLKRYTSQTLATKKALRSELEEIRKTGYAVNRGEWVETVRGLAAPIRNSEGHVIAALNLSIPAERLERPHITKLAPLVVESALAISRGLGFSPSLLAIARRED